MIPSTVIVALCGLKDSFNPCALVTVLFLLFLVSELRRRRIHASRYAALFISAVFIWLLVLSLDALMPIIYSSGFLKAARVFYIVAGFFLAVCGAVHLGDWLRMRRQGNKPSFFPLVSVPDAEPEWRMDIKIVFLTVFSAALLSTLSTIWPPDGYVSFYLSFLYLPGKTAETYILMLIYNLSLMASLIAAYVLVSSRLFARSVRQNPAMVKIIISAFTLSLGTGLIYIFY